jgi:hypothetical protein
MNKTKNKEYQAFLKKLRSETVYFKNTFENALIKSDPDGGYMVKINGRPAFQADPQSGLIADAILEYKEIPAAEYEKA